MDLPKTDPYNGMYLASFGEHGAELLRLYRENIDGEEVVIAQKLTGGWLTIAVWYHVSQSPSHCVT